MARVDGVDVTPQHIRAVARGDKHLSPTKMAALSSWLVDELGLTEHLGAFLGVSGQIHFAPESVDADGDIRHEVMDARQDAAQAIQILQEAGPRPSDSEKEEAARHIRDAIGDFLEALEDIQSA
jgi:hypothetical protein